KGVDALYPTSEFSSWAETFAKNNHEKTIIFTCRTGNRSGQLQRIFKNHGIENVINHGGGIVSYRGEITR
ncbi:MAG TPA: rhodanese-like domain-containing protein, partial [Epsilonproteobacteria bacterium]|nr:rhodanese-like domain-containing protein [Campylobacterota bacterium]